MQHRRKGKILGRTTGPKKALYRNLATSLVLYEKIKTTEAKAKSMRPIIDRLVTKGKKNDLAARRYLLKYLTTEGAVKKVLEVLSPKYSTRPGGYTRITKLGQRRGDAAKVVQIEFV